MNRLTKLFLCLCFFSMIFVAADPTSAERDTKNESNKVFLMEISAVDRPAFRLAVKADQKPVAVVPMKGTTASAVKIVPTAEGDSLRFDLLAVVESLPKTLSCDAIRTLKTEKVTSYVAKGDKSIQVSDFGRFGIGSFVVKVSLVPADALYCPERACCCDNITCMPDWGYCMTCGSCGMCCHMS